MLDVASRLFAVAGFNGTSINDVAQQAGLSTAGLLHHFPSKRHLLAAVLAKRDRDDARALELLGGADAGVWDLLERMVQVARFNSTRYGMVKLYTMLSGEAVDREHPAHGWLRDHLVTLVGDLAAAFEAGKAAGTVRPDAPSDSLARLVVAALDGLQVQWLAGGDAPVGREQGPGRDMGDIGPEAGRDTGPAWPPTSGCSSTAWPGSTDRPPRPPDPSARSPRFARAAARRRTAP